MIRFEGRNFALAAALTLVLTLSLSAARAQDNNRNQRSTGEQWQSENGQNSFDQTDNRIRGRIENLRQVTLRNSQGTREAHTLARLKTQGGRLITADLGPKADLSDLDLQKGDRITVWGHEGTIDGRPVLFADQIRSGDQTIDVARAGATPEQNQSDLENRWYSRNNAPNDQFRSGQEGGQFTEQNGQFTLRGRVTGYQVISMESGQRRVSMLNLRLANGRSVLIDAGDNPKLLDLKDLDLRDRVLIKGHTEDVQGHDVLIADKVQFINPDQTKPSAAGKPGQQQKSTGGGSSQNQSQSGRKSDDQQ